MPANRQLERLIVASELQQCVYQPRRLARKVAELPEPLHAFACLAELALSSRYVTRQQLHVTCRGPDPGIEEDDRAALRGRGPRLRRSRPAQCRTAHASLRAGRRSPTGRPPAFNSWLRAGEGLRSATAPRRPAWAPARSFRGCPGGSPPPRRDRRRRGRSARLVQNSTLAAAASPCQNRSFPASQSARPRPASSFVSSKSWTAASTSRRASCRLTPV